MCTKWTYRDRLSDPLSDWRFVNLIAASLPDVGEALILLYSDEYNIGKVPKKKSAFYFVNSKKVIYYSSILEVCHHLSPVRHGHAWGLNDLHAMLSAMNDEVAKSGGEFLDYHNLMEAGII